MRTQFFLITILMQLELIVILPTDAFFSSWFARTPRTLVRREVPSLQDVMDEAVLRRAEIDEERERVRRERRNAMGSYAGYGDEENEMDAPHLTREELEESKRKSLVMTQLLDSIFNNYDMYIRPGFQESEPLLVESNMVLTSMGPFSDFEARPKFRKRKSSHSNQAQSGGGEGEDGGRRIAVDPEAGVQVSGGGGGRKGDSSSYPVIPEFTFQCFFRHFWRDKRLAFEDRLTQLVGDQGDSGGGLGDGGVGSNETIETLMLNSIMLSRVWKPDTFFRGNGQNSYIHDITRPNQLFRLNRKGEINFSTRLTISARCPMDFSNFPMDEQECIVEFGSFGYDNSQIVYRWREQSDKAITIEADDLRLSQFQFRYHEYSSRNISYASGNYSTLTIKFNFRRNVGYFIMQTYLPCMMIVVLSWVAFWINREAAPARISLGITTVLTMTTFAISSRQQIPKVSYPSAMDWFVLMCYFFVFFALVEYAAVNYFTKRSEAGKAPPAQKVGSPPAAKKPRLSSNQCDRWNCTMYTPHSQHDFPVEAEHCRDADYDQEHESGPGQGGTGYGGQNGIEGEGRGGNQMQGMGWNSGTAEMSRDEDEPPFEDMNSFFIRFVVCLCGSVQYKTYKLDHITTQFNSVSHIDELCRVAFPAMFMLFNVFYWSIYFPKD
ncbi:gamma-aminobutyric acid receptor subunit gamma-2-like isoform X2 [Symsagittifera roscoffensis]|uniref:gamma-aminobutyric acid receptor subunit gamma-2-like isoform X2 n=1 Tax=Symsagittifera roscoffensis TaxID=84072 RepID=UPI00307B997F